jgi:hypothetical protein
MKYKPEAPASGLTAQPAVDDKHAIVKRTTRLRFGLVVDCFISRQTNRSKCREFSLISQISNIHT